jgi:hypothetical protein
LLNEVRALGCQGTYKAVGKIVSPWRQGNVDFERAADDITIPAPPPPVLTDPTQRQISPHIAATLLTIKSAFAPQGPPFSIPPIRPAGGGHRSGSSR